MRQTTRTKWNRWLLAVLVAPSIGALERVDSLVLQHGESELRSAFIDADGEHAWFVSGTPTSRLIRVNLDTFERNGLIVLDDGDRHVFSGSRSPDGRYAYLANFVGSTSGWRIIKVDLLNHERIGFLQPFQPVQTGSFTTSVIDPSGQYAFFATQAFPGVVYRVDLDGFQLAGGVVLASGENNIHSSVIDPAGEFAYFGTGTVPARVVKVSLDPFQRVAALTLEEGENGTRTAVIDPDGRYAYFATNTSPARLVKIDLEDFQRVDALTLEAGESFLRGGQISPDGSTAWFATRTDPGRVIRINLDAFERETAITLESGESWLEASVLDVDRGLLIHGTDVDPMVGLVEPGRLIRVMLDGSSAGDLIFADGFEG